MKKKTSAISLITIIIVLSPLLYVYTANAASTANLTVTLNQTPTAVGQTFIASINVAGVENLWAWGAKVTWNPAVLNATNLVKGTFLGQNGDSSFFSPVVYDNVAGTLKGGPSDTLLTTSGISGDGVLAKITFVVVGTGSTDIALSNVELLDNTFPNHNNLVFTLGQNLTINIPSTSNPTPSPTPTSSSPTPTPTGQPAIHVSTDKTRYQCGDLVSVTANVTYNGGSVANRDVAFTVMTQNKTNIATIVNTTNSNGLAAITFRVPTPQPDATVIFGDWSILAAVEVAQVNINGTANFIVGNSVVIATVLTPTSVQRGSSVPINVTLQNLGNIQQGLTLTACVLDSAKVPLGTSTISINAQTQGNTTIGTTIFIPQWAFTGQATVYVNLLTAPPQQGGVPYASQAISHFQIT